MNNRHTTRGDRARCISVGAVVMLLLSGCKVGPNYEQPKMATPDSFTHTSAEGFQAGSLPDTGQSVDAQWWTLLGDEKLDGLIGRAVARNLDVRLATARVREARAQRGVVAAEGLPQVDVAADATRARVSKNAFPGAVNAGRATNLFEAGFDANWELDVFGRVGRNVEAAEADIQSAQESRRDVLVSLVSEVARNYVELRGAQQRLGIARKNIDIQSKTLDLAKARFNAGLTSDLDVAQAESSLAAVQAIVPGLDTEVQAAAHRIGVLLGEQPTALLAELLEIGPIPAIPGAVPVGLPSELLRRRPDIRRSERDIAAATARIGVATADLFPRFSITGSFGFAADKVASLPDASSRFWSIGPAVRWPILDWGRIRSNIRVEDARTEQALVIYERTVLTSFEEVENALVAYTREQAKLKSLQAAVASNQRAFGLANQLYTSGITDFQRVLDSQRSLFLSEDALTDSQRAVTSDVVALYKALGGGWETFAPEPDEATPRAPVSSLFFKTKENAE